MRRADLRGILPGWLALAAIGLLVGGAFVGLVGESLGNLQGASSAFDSYLGRVAAFTLWQALLSTALSVLPAISVARAISRHPAMPGRAALLALFAVPLALPAIVAALGILALLGTAGLLAPTLSALSGGQWPGIYGLSGILVAHVFFNMPLATRLFLEALETVPGDQWRLASQLGMRAGPSFRLIEWPVLRAALPGVAGLVFMLCVTSFTIVLTLGGGPRATTLEVAIYQALRFDFDPPRAVAITISQIVLTAAVLFILTRLGANLAAERSATVSRHRFVQVSLSESAANLLVVGVAGLFVVAPLAAVVISGLQADLGRLLHDPAVRSATATSLLLGAASAVLSIWLSWSLIAMRQKLSASGRRSAGWLKRIVDSGAGFVLVVPPIVIGAGWFLLLRTRVDVLSVAPVMVVAVNAVMAMPFAVRAIRPGYDAAAARHDRLAQQLGIAGWNRIRLIDWPVLRRPVLTGFAFAMALSLGDLGVIALFGSDAVQTLPYLLLGRMGSYRTADAAGIALLLGVLCLALMLAADWLGKEKT